MCISAHVDRLQPDEGIEVLIGDCVDSFEHCVLPMRRQDHAEEDYGPYNSNYARDDGIHSKQNQARTV